MLRVLEWRVVLAMKRTASTRDAYLLLLLLLLLLLHGETKGSRRGLAWASAVDRLLVKVRRVWYWWRLCLSTHGWRCRCVSIREQCGSWSPGDGSLLRHARCSRLHQSILDGAHQLVRKDRAGVHGTRNRVFPCLEHLFHLATDVVVDDGV